MIQKVPGPTCIYLSELCSSRRRGSESYGTFQSVEHSSRYRSLCNGGDTCKLVEARSRRGLVLSIPTAVLLTVDSEQVVRPLELRFVLRRNEWSV